MSLVFRKLGEAGGPGVAMKGRHMRPARQKGIASALVAAEAIFACAAATGAVARASRRAVVSSPRVSTGTGQFRCPASGCAVVVRSTSSTSSLRVQATEVPSAGAPSSARAKPADKGTLTWNQESDHPLTCGGYTASDRNSYQFFLGESTLGNVLYAVTYTIKNTDPSRAKFCLGARFSFTTSSGAGARRVKLPNGLSGFAGVLPQCRPAQLGQLVACVVSKTRSGSDTLLKAQVPAIGGDPWGRS